MAAVKRRLACPLTVQHLWDAVSSIRQQRQIPNLDRISNYMRRKHNLSPTDLERQLNFAQKDDLLRWNKKLGCKGSKTGVEQEFYNLPEGEVDKDGHDWYCFECHRGGEMNMCTTCHRVYHSFCIKEEPVLSEEFICTVCKLLKAKIAFKAKKEDLNTLLSFTCLRLKEKMLYLHRMPHPEEEKWRHDFLVYQQMDLITMDEKTHANKYSRVEEFQVDAQSIVHNVVIYYGVHSTMADMARQMLRDCIYDLGEIRQCRECYRMSNEKVDKFWFCQPCDPPHELVFAKQKGFPFWPAKVIRIENNMYDVRFFGGYHQRANIEQSQIRPITSTIQQLGLKQTSALNKAMDELRRHQNLLDKRKGKRKASPVDKKSRKKGDEEDEDENMEVESRGDDEDNASEKEEDVKKSQVKEDREVAPQQAPSSSSAPKIRRLMECVTSDDNNVVTSSSQEAPVAKVSASTQTNKKLLESLIAKHAASRAGSTSGSNSTQGSGSCNCDTKYSKMIRDLQDKLEREHQLDKDRALKEMADRIRAEYEEEEKRKMSATVGKMHGEMEIARLKVEEQLRLTNQHAIREIQERHKQEISETKKKQWCYNCEAEAIYHCCWNTSYCSVECQQVHWHKEHKRTCRRKR